MPQDTTEKTRACILGRLVYIAIYIVLVVISTVIMTESSGILRTLPFIVILPAVATIFYNKKILTLLLCFIITLIFALVENAAVFDAAFTAICALFFAGCGIIAKRLFVTAYVSREKRTVCSVLGTVLMVAGIVFYGYVFGNPFSALSAKSENLSYLSHTYGENAPDARYTYFDISERRYFTKVSFYDETIMNADIAAENNSITDGYSNYYEYKHLISRREKLSQILSDRFAQPFAIKINVQDTSVKASPQTIPEDVYGQMVFDIAFYGQITERRDFAQKCKDYSQYLNEAGFSYSKINYYGGFADDFMFQMEVSFGFSGNYEDLVTSFDGESFDRYYDESDYAQHWEYGK